MRVALVSLVVLAVAGPVLAQQTTPGNEPPKLASSPKPGDIVINPEYAQWADFAVGTSVTQKEVVTLADGTIVESLMTAKLVSKNEHELKVETTVAAVDAAKRVDAADETKTFKTYPAKLKFEDIQTPESDGYSVTAGKEVLDVKGKRIEAEWVEASATNSDGSVTEKDWYTADVPGGLVKQTVTKKKGAQVTSQSMLELVDVKAKREAKKQ
jgi:hypothetical protein